MTSTEVTFGSLASSAPIATSNLQCLLPFVDLASSVPPGLPPPFQEINTREPTMSYQNLKISSIPMPMVGSREPLTDQMFSPRVTVHSFQEQSPVTHHLQLQHWYTQQATSRMPSKYRASRSKENSKKRVGRRENRRRR